MIRKFQSLFLWIFRSHLPGIPGEIRHNSEIVSILVLMDLSFLHILVDILMVLEMTVSILVLMDLSFLH